MEIEFPQSFQENLQKVNEYLNDQFDGYSSNIHQIIKFAISRDDQRIRSGLTFSIGGLMGVDPGRLLDLAAAIELLYTATLIHDALIEDSILRRGLAPFDEGWHPAAVVLAGDLVFALASKLAAKTRSTVVMEMFARTLATITNSDVTQLLGNGSKFDRDVYLQWVYAKTASVFELAAGAAVKIAGLGDDVFSLARQLGKSFGMAYQITEDIPNFKNNGKPHLNFIGKNTQNMDITFLVMYYLQSNSLDPVHTINMHKNDQQSQAPDRSVGDVRDCEAIVRYLQVAHEFIQQSLGILAGFPASPPRMAFESLAYDLVIQNE